MAGSEAGHDGLLHGRRGAPALVFDKMKTFLTVVLVIAMLAVVGVLLAGVIGLVRGGNDPRRSNKLMRARVVLQAVALGIFALLLLLLKNT